MLAPANKDLPCVVNESEELTGEINLIDGRLSLYPYFYMYTIKFLTDFKDKYSLLYRAHPQ